MLALAVRRATTTMVATRIAAAMTRTRASWGQGTTMVGVGTTARPWSSSVAKGSTSHAIRRPSATPVRRPTASRKACSSDSHAES